MKRTEEQLALERAMKRVANRNTPGELPEPELEALAGLIAGDWGGSIEESRDVALAAFYLGMERATAKPRL